ncbi:hypothetical protein [Mariniflexile sp.]
MVKRKATPKNQGRRPGMSTFLGLWSNPDSYRENGHKLKSIGTVVQL